MLLWTVVLEKTLESPLDWKEIQPVHPKGNQSWIFIGRTDAETEAPILGHLMQSIAKNWLTGKKNPDARKDWRGEEKGTTEDEMVGWHHWLRHESEQTLGDSEGQGSPVCCSPWGCKKLDITERLNWTDQITVQCILKIWEHREDFRGVWSQCLLTHETNHSISSSVSWIMDLQGCLCPNPQNLWICYLTHFVDTVKVKTSR